MVTKSQHSYGFYCRKKRIYEYLETRKERDGDGEFDKYVVTVIRLFDPKGRFTGQHMMKIRARHVRDVLNERYRDVDDLMFPEAEKLSLVSTFQQSARRRTRGLP